ncbi:unnamed protein product [Rotaria socialis]|uniref:Exonuclease domain-containing protein n=1 Tax=Rotaria socialis TaxID=392032 RepID=A0A819X549_9BILA|nr:unnamed protein product [Rotaria socialis]CAF3308897.1 unnamed protein product [Rotaria socialis]CAF3442512.1 unnamed protein product [Rotaria socialis]CAF3474928.1 unnamed protein product [Rotaria socialis]CAF3675574.1 unnamed protein product [Rotaria socialis]
MASSLTKTDSNLLKNHTSDPDRIRVTKTSLRFAEEQRLLNSKSHASKTSAKNQVSQKSLNKFCNRVHQMTPEELDEQLKRRKLSTSGELDILRCRLKHHYKLELTFGCENPSTMIEQPFQYIAVLDFEATCEENHDDNYKNEIIEFPIVLIDVKQQIIIDKFQSYCRPTLKPVLSTFCTQLTGIKQHQVDNAPTFVEVLHNVEKWLNERNLLSTSNGHKLAFSTDGPWDFTKFLQVQCRLSSIVYPQWAEEWIDIRKEFSRFYSVRRGGIEKMLHRLGLTFDGRPHSGIDDSINIARITLELLKDGCVLSFNDGIRTSGPKATTMADKKNEEEDSIMLKD